MGSSDIASGSPISLKMYPFWRGELQGIDNLPVPGDQQDMVYITAEHRAGFRQNIISSSTTPPLVTSPDNSEEESKSLKRILGLLSLQVLNEETSNCKEEVKPPPATTTARGLVRSSGWNFLRCAYMVITFFFVSYNKGDWCYCHYCNPDLDLRDDPCCSFQ
ncbi:epididymal protein 13-like [Apodemus sylvaticus]|uniref:epididymal protein 13-like n=1 Tax=Apodemus sylvaticus TaxID=10129 RepID=UPI002241A765|nr:epididymal protein 13-like [Apodemus sylvaticus]